MKPVVHAVAGGAAMLTIASFWVATVISELFLDHAAVAAVKHAIVYGLFLLVPTLVATGGSGFILARTRRGRRVTRKQTRMRFIAANGVLVMIPAALFLNSRAAAGRFDASFYAVQAVELLVGAVQLALMGLNFRDGRRLAGKQCPRAA